MARFIVASGGWVYGGDCGGWANGNRFLHTKPNTENKLLAYFSQHRQTIENILHIAKRSLRCVFGREFGVGMMLSDDCILIHVK